MTVPRFDHWFLDYGDAEDDAVAVSPDALARNDLSTEGFVLLHEEEVWSLDERWWPRVSGNQVIWAVGRAERDIVPVAVTTADRADDRSLLSTVRERLLHSDVESAHRTSSEGRRRRSRRNAAIALLLAALAFGSFGPPQIWRGAAARASETDR